MKVDKKLLIEDTKDIIILIFFVFCCIYGFAMIGTLFIK